MPTRPLPTLEVTVENVRLRSGERGRRVLVDHDAYQPKARPFLKWAGGKQWLVPLADALLPKPFTGRYYEPFAGGGAIFFALSPLRATLNDVNEELAATYEALRDDAERTIDLLKSYPHDKSFYDDLRERRPRAPYTRAARMIYLNKTAYNGLYRVSRAGRFNVPFGRYVRPTICNVNRLRLASAALKNATVTARPFRAAVAQARAGDFAFFDPPYITGHANNGFLKYNARLFSWDDQIALAKRVRSLTEGDVRVAVSNADHPAVRALYPGSYGYRIKRRSAIGGGLDYRGQVSELLLTNFPLFERETPRLS